MGGFRERFLIWEFSGKGFCLKGEGKVGVSSISDKGNLIHLRPAQIRYCSFRCVIKLSLSRSVWAKASLCKFMQVHILPFSGSPSQDVYKKDHHHKEVYYETKSQDVVPETHKVIRLQDSANPKQEILCLLTTLRMR